MCVSAEEELEQCTKETRIIEDTHLSNTPPKVTVTALFLTPIKVIIALVLKHILRLKVVI